MKMKKTYLYPEMELASYESEMSLYKPVFETAIKQLKALKEACTFSELMKTVN